MYAKIERIRIGIGLINRNKANTYVSSRTPTLCITYKLMRLAVPEIPARVRGRLAAVSSLLLGDRSDHIVCIFTSPSRGSLPSETKYPDRTAPASPPDVGDSGGKNPSHRAAALPVLPSAAPGGRRRDKPVRPTATAEDLLPRACVRAAAGRPDARRRGRRSGPVDSRWLPAAVVGVVLEGAAAGGDPPSPQS